MIGQSINKGLTKKLRISNTVIVIICLALAVAASQSAAQRVQLTPEQQLMLDQLPASQRQQALQALEQLNRQESGDTEQADDAADLSGLPQDDLSPSEEFQEMLGEPKAVGGSRLVINLNPKFDLSPAETRTLQDDVALQGIQGSRYYELDESGVLVLPGLPSVPLLGLTAEAITQRLGAEPSLDLFDVSVSILDTESIELLECLQRLLPLARR